MSEIKKWNIEEIDSDLNGKSEEFNPVFAESSHEEEKKNGTVSEPWKLHSTFNRVSALVMDAESAYWKRYKKIEKCLWPTLFKTHDTFPY